MNERIEIKLTEAGKSNLLTTDDWAVLDLDSPTETKVPLSKDVEQLSVENQINLEGATPFTIPRNAHNDACLLPFANPLSLDNRTTGIECQYWKGIVQQPFNFIYYRSKNAKTWELEFRVASDHWAIQASTKRLCTIDIPTPNGPLQTIGFELTSEWETPAYEEEVEILGIPVPGPADRWTLIDYGGWVDLAEPQQLTEPPQKQVFIEDLRPVFSEVFLLKRGFCEIGWNLTGKILETDEVLRMWAYVVDPLYYLKSKGGNHKLTGSRLSAGEQISTDYNPVVLDGIDYDPGTNAVLRPLSSTRWGAGLKNTLPYKARYKFCFSGYVKNDGGTDGSVTFQSQLFTTVDTGEFIGDEFSEQIAAGQTSYLSFCLNVDLEKDQIALLSFLGDPSGNIVLLEGFRFSAEPNQKSLVRGDQVKLNELIDCQYFLLDLFKGFIHKINGLVETDFVTKTITIFPNSTADVRDEIVQGFIKQYEGIDISDLIICESIKLTPLRSTQNKYTEYKFADSTDAYIDSLKLPNPAHSREIFNGEELKDAVTPIQNPFFEPTLERRSDVLKRKFVQTDNAPYFLELPYLPVLTDNVSGERSFSIGPRTLYALGKGTQSNPTDNRPATIYFEETPIANFLYLSQKNTWFFRLEDTTPGPVARMVYGVTEKDLFSTFYLGSSLTSKWGTQIDALVRMTDAHYSDWNFRKPFGFLFEGWSVTAQGIKITDHQPPLPTPMTFIVAPSESECCDLPCSCQFSECLYWQDFGQYITQETVDSLQITSFKLNNKQLLDAPVGFGILNVVGVYGQSYVTNLVDALNSIGVPYFTFNYSGKTSTKPDGRFFSIKRPICYNFEILIEDSDGVVYRYTDLEQWQSVFGTEQPMGYMAESYDEPIDCVITTEY